MAHNFFKPKGMLRANTPEAGGASVLTAPVLGVVKNNIDPIRQGRIWVYISELGNADPEDASGWVGVSYLSPFFGSVDGTASSSTDGTYTSNPSSYGFWSSPPDLGTKVLCIFVNGDPSYGFYIGCVPEAEKLQMVPAIGAVSNVIPNSGEAASLGGALRLPVTNINSNNPAISNDPNFIEKPKPVHSYAAAIFAQQGLVRDPIRGPISSSASRESPSRVGWGVNTPGRPIYEGGYDDTTIVTRGINGTGTIPSLKIIARRSGHSIVMDDGDIVGKDQLVRIRTALGHQILMSDDGQTLLLIHANGQSYIELGKEGTIDMFSTNSVNIRTQGDLNLHADNNINLHAVKKFNVRADNIKLQSDTISEIKTGTDFVIDNGSTYTHKVMGPMSLSSSGDASFASTNSTFINGSRINLNTGSTSTTPKTIPDIVLKSHTDTLFDKVKGFAAAPDLLKSITSRTPAHMPWSDAGKGVSIKTNASPTDVLPSLPSSSVSSVNRVVSAAGVTQPVTSAGISTIPDASAVSKSLDKASSTSLVGAVAQAAGTGITKDAVKVGYGIVREGANTVASVGSLAQSPKDLENAGILKPGSAALVNSLVNSGKSVESAMTTNLFTGKEGAVNLMSVVNNVTTQVNAQIVNFQRAQSALTAAGLITGKESAGALGGLVLAGSRTGIAGTLNTVRNVANIVSNLPSNTQPNISSVTNAATQLISAGAYAATLVNRSSGAPSVLANALSVVNSVGKIAGSINEQGITGASFTAIVNQFLPLIPNRPQDLAAIARNSAAKRKSEFGGNELQVISSVGSILGGPAGNILSSSANVVGAVGNIATGTNIARATNSLIKNAGQIASTYASGLDNLPGGQAVVSSVRDLTSNVPVPGTSRIKSVIDNTVTAVNNGIPVDQAVKSAYETVGKQVTAVTAGITNFAANIASGANSLVSLASTGLSANESAQLNSITNVADDGISESSTPTVAVNTYDRAAISVSSEAILGSNLIPPPKFDSPSEEAVSALASTLQGRAELADLEKQLEEAQTALLNAQEQWINEVNAPIPNAARVASLRAAVDAALREVNRIAVAGIALEKTLGIRPA